LAGAAGRAFAHDLTRLVGQVGIRGTGASDERQHRRQDQKSRFRQSTFHDAGHQKQSPHQRKTTRVFSRERRPQGDGWDGLTPGCGLGGHAFSRVSLNPVQSGLGPELAWDAFHGRLERKRGSDI
jgi:hypothetical protein